MNKTIQKLLINLVIVIVVFLFGSTSYAQLDNFELVAANEYLELYIDPLTTEVAINDLRTDKIWFTNPQDRDSTRGFVLNRLSSQFTLIHDPDEIQKDNHRFSIEYDQFEINLIENGVRIDYTVVEEWRAEHYAPRMISKERMETEVLAGLENEADHATVLDVYNLIMLVPLGDKEHEPIPGVDQKRLFGDYEFVVLNPDHLEQQEELNALQIQLSSLEGSDEEVESTKADLERQISQLQTRLQREKEDLINRLIYTLVDYRLDIEISNEITHDDVKQLINTPTYLMGQVPRFTLTRMQNVITETGYTPLEAGEDHLLNNLDPILANMQTFVIPIEYILDQSELLVRILVDEIEYPMNIENRIGEVFSFPVLSIRLLENFGAANIDQEGYIFIPDGSGALINLNNGRLFASGFNEPVYGRDNSIEPLNEVRRYPEVVRLPVFGIKQDDHAMFAIIEEGAAFANIRADISGRSDNYNRVYTEFRLLPRSRVSLSVETDNIEFSGSLPVYQMRLYEGNYQIRYAFLSGDEANYVGMAHYYQDYLISKHELNPLKARENIPFYLELVGAIDKKEPVLGIARNVIRPLTTFGQAQSILTSLAERGIANIHLKYTGWLSGGINHVYPRSVSIERSLGGADEFKDLVEFAKANGHQIYPSVGFLNVYRNSWFNGFSTSNDAAYFINRLQARVYDYNLDTFERRREGRYLVSPRILEDLTARFLSDYDQYQLNNIALFDLARELNSDFIYDINKLVDREQALQIVTNSFANIKDAGYNIMVDHGNSYAIPYVNSIINMPMSSSSYHIVNEDIPFYQIVLHGLIDYAGQPLNLSSNYQIDFLKLLESGSYPYFMGSYEDSSELKDTKYDYLYALNYSDWLNLAVELYGIANEVLGDVQDQRIVEHQKLMENVNLTRFENGKVIIVNYNKETVHHEYGSIDGESFIVLEGIFDEN